MIPIRFQNSICLFVFGFIFSFILPRFHSEAGEFLEPDPRIDVAVRAADATLKRLRSALMTQMQQGGDPAEAIRLCHVLAQPLTEEEVSGEILQIRRATLKPRNPKNQAKPDEKKVLEKWAKLQKNGKPLPEFEAIVFKKDLHFYRPLKVERMCLTCHGEKKEIPENVRTKIQKLYPKDKATGYKEGGLRGLIHVVVR